MLPGPAVLLWCTCAPSGVIRWGIAGELLKETSKESPISGKFLPVKGAHRSRQESSEAAWDEPGGAAVGAGEGGAPTATLPAAVRLERVVSDRSQQRGRHRTAKTLRQRAGWTAGAGEGFPVRPGFPKSVRVGSQGRVSTAGSGRERAAHPPARKSLDGRPHRRKESGR
ncbi:hypothetical protein GCM10022384_15580 [Streptomyces marokkonensis]|uniref:Secreted protein n=1 Tax=Streptomyces marokkonensis TaxID=324855 RepID=A0ABP7PFM1_9ACTN